MDFTFSDEEQAVAELGRKILEDLATNERQKEIEAGDAAWDEKLYKALGDANLLGTALPEAHGGSDLGFMALCRLLQEVGRSVAQVPAYPALVLGGLPLARFGNDEQQKNWLPGVVEGTLVLTAALQEYDSSNPLVLTTIATKADGGYRLTGTKSIVPCASQSASILIPARTPDGDVLLFWVAPNADGVTVTDQATSDGLPYGQVELEGALVRDSDRLGAEGEGALQLKWLVQRAIAARCMMQLGVIERALEMTADYTRERIQFGRPIGAFQAVHQRAADAYINVECVRLTAWEVTWRLSQELPSDEHVAVAKFWAAEGGQNTAYACQHLHGGIGIDIDYPLHRYFKWATQLEHELGSARHQLEVLGRSIAASGLPPA